MLSCASPSCPRELVDDGLSGGLLVGRALRNDIHERINRCVDQAVYEFTTGVELSLKVHLQNTLESDSEGRSESRKDCRQCKADKAKAEDRG